MATKPTAKIGVSFVLDSGRTVCLYEGDVVHGLKYKEGLTTKTINGSVRVINASPRTINNKHICPPEPYVATLLNISSIIIDSSTEFDADFTTISINTIVDVDSIEQNDGAIVVGPGSQYNTLSQVLDMAPVGAAIELANGVYEEDITINKSVKIFSNSGAILKGAIVVNAPVTLAADDTTHTEVELEGLYITGKATFLSNNLDSFKMSNCIWRDCDYETKRTCPILLKGEQPVEVHMDNNIFGAQNDNCYNIFECWGAVKDGSTFNNNKFEGSSCTHNQISIYRSEDDAVISINNNFCQNSANMIRFGFIGDCKCTVNMNGNSYAETDEMWPGLFLIQPYGTQTTNLSNVTINVNNTTKPVGAIGYYYAGANDAKLTPEQMAKVYIDGALTELPDLS